MPQLKKIKKHHKLYTIPPHDYNEPNNKLRFSIKNRSYKRILEKLNLENQDGDLLSLYPKE